MFAAAALIWGPLSLLLLWCFWRLDPSLIASQKLAWPWGWTLCSSTIPLWGGCWELHSAALAACPLLVLLQRVSLTVLVTLVVVAVARWLANPLSICCIVRCRCSG